MSQIGARSHATGAGHGAHGACVGHGAGGAHGGGAGHGAWVGHGVWVGQGHVCSARGAHCARSGSLAPCVARGSSRAGGVATAGRGAPDGA